MEIKLNVCVFNYVDWVWTKYNCMFQVAGGIVVGGGGGMEAVGGGKCIHFVYRCEDTCVWIATCSKWSNLIGHIYPAQKSIYVCR